MVSIDKETVLQKCEHLNMTKLCAMIVPEHLVITLSSNVDFLQFVPECLHKFFWDSIWSGVRGFGQIWHIFQSCYDTFAQTHVL